MALCIVPSAARYIVVTFAVDLGTMYRALTTDGNRSALTDSIHGGIGEFSVKSSHCVT